jgi:hypothetical protein
VPQARVEGRKGGRGGGGVRRGRIRGVEIQRVQHVEKTRTDKWVAEFDMGGENFLARRTLVIERRGVEVIEKRSRDMDMRRGERKKDRQKKTERIFNILKCFTKGTCTIVQTSKF